MELPPPPVAHRAALEREHPTSMLQGHPLIGYGLAALLALGAVVALVGLNGLVAAVLGALAWLALPENGMRVTPVRAAARRSRPR